MKGTFIMEKMNFAEWLYEQEKNSDNILAPSLNSQLALSFLIDYLLDDNWCIDYFSEYKIKEITTKTHGRSPSFFQANIPPIINNRAIIIAPTKAIIAPMWFGKMFL